MPCVVATGTTGPWTSGDQVARLEAVVLHHQGRAVSLALGRLQARASRC
jgi:hypothetical protein